MSASTRFSRQPWGFNPNWTRVEALDDRGCPLGYVYFVPRDSGDAQPGRPTFWCPLLDNVGEIWNRLTAPIFA